MDEIDDPTRPRYSAPALEKGLDILELLAEQPHGLAAKAIADRLGRSMGELFRMLMALERRGFIRRLDDGSYELGLHLFELASRHPPLERLRAAALPEMNRLAELLGQSCHLAVHDDGRILVLARVESPRPWSLMVRIGETYALTRNVSGRVLLAFQPAALCSAWLARAAEREEAGPPQGLDRRLASIRATGHEAGPSDAVGGVLNVSCPILGRSGHALAALTVPLLELQGERIEPDPVITAVREAARRVATRLGLAG